MNRSTAILAAALGLSLAGQAQEAGVGVRLNGTAGATLYAPLKLNDAFMLEGTLSHQQFKEETTPAAGSTTTFETKATEVGVGLFWLKGLGESTRAYAGPRLSYGKESTTSGLRADSQGFTVTPTLGVEYFPVRHVSLGGEIGLAYGHQTGHATDVSGEASTRKTQAYTVSSVVLRYYF